MMRDRSPSASQLTSHQAEPCASLEAVVPGFARAAATPGGSVTDPNPFDRLYAYAWFVTFGLSFVAYLVLMRRKATRASP